VPELRGRMTSSNWAKKTRMNQLSIFEKAKAKA
jgi:hypothetical protein